LSGFVGFQSPLQEQRAETPNQLRRQATTGSLVEATIRSLVEIAGIWGKVIAGWYTQCFRYN